MKMKQSILISALTLARKNGLMQFTRLQLAEHAACSEANVSYHYGTMEKLRTALVIWAVECESVDVLAQARALRHPALQGRLTPALKERVANYLMR